MGNTIWLTFREGEDKESIDYDHSIMYQLEQELGRIARKHGVKEPSEYFDHSEIAAEFSGESGVPGPEPKWFDSKDGLKTIEVLLEHLSNNPDLFTFPGDSTRSHWRVDLMEELKH